MKCIELCAKCIETSRKELWMCQQYKCIYLYSTFLFDRSMCSHLYFSNSQRLPHTLTHRLPRILPASFIFNIISTSSQFAHCTKEMPICKMQSTRNEILCRDRKCLSYWLSLFCSIYINCLDRTPLTTLIPFFTQFYTFMPFSLPYLFRRKRKSVRFHHPRHKYTQNFLTCRKFCGLLYWPLFLWNYFRSFQIHSWFIFPQYFKHNSVRNEKNYVKRWKLTDKISQ